MRHHNMCVLERLSFAVLMLAIIVAGISAERTYAAENGIYTAAAYAHYRHPYTGVIEDSGGENSYELGQSMTESALYSGALVEVDPSGNTFVTVRMKLMDNINDVSFQADAAGNGSFYSVGAQVMQEDYGANTCDFRMQVPSEHAVIRCNMYVVPMGRSVIFYITLGGLSAGSGDFITSVAIEEPSAPVPETPQTGGDSGTGQTVKDSDSSARDGSGSTQSEAEKPNDDSSQTTADKTQQDEKKTKDDVKSDKAETGIAEFDASGKRVDGKETEEKSGSGKTVVIISAIGIAVLGGGYAGFRFYSKRKG